MILGSITPQGRALLPLTIFGQDGAETDLLTVLDTGFSGDLVLPPSTITALRLLKFGGQRVMLADGRSAWMDIYRAGVDWDGHRRSVYVLEAGDVPLVGTGLLRGCRLTADWVDGGDVQIVPLTPIT